MSRDSRACLSAFALRQITFLGRLSSLRMIDITTISPRTTAAVLGLFVVLIILLGSMRDGRVKVTLPPDDQDKEYSFPGKKEGTVEKFKIYQMKEEELKELCLAHNLLVGGKKAILQERLREFSEEPGLWDSIKPALRGPKNPGKAPKTGYQKRQLALMANTEPQPEFEDTSDQDKKGREILEWARAYVKSHPEIQQPSPPLPQGFRPFNKHLWEPF